MNIAEFHFLRPFWLLMLIPFTALLMLLRRKRLVRGSWAAACDPQLLPYLLIGGGHSQRRGPLTLIGVGGLLAITALAGPTWERTPMPVYRNTSALVLVLDLSLSMNAGDIKPSRLQRARFKITDILQRRKDGQTALIVYGDDAFTVTPLSEDVETIRNQLGALSPAIMPGHARMGSAVPALHRAMDLLRQAGAHNGDILLITDGIAPQAIDAARDLHADGARISVLGAGTEQGAPIPLAGGFMKDENGTIIVPRLDSIALRTLASAGGGLYHPLTTDNSDLSALRAAIEPGNHSTNGEHTTHQMEQWKDRGPWLLLPLLPLAALAFRRGYLGIVLLSVLPASNETQAMEWMDLWKTRDQQAIEAYRNGDMETAWKQFDDPSWKAAAAYAAGHYEQAAAALKEMQDSDSHYNKGNALARMGRFEEAIAAYDKALELKPGSEDALYNKKLIERLLEQQRQLGKSPPNKEQSQNDPQQTSEENQREPDQQKPEPESSESRTDRSQTGNTVGHREQPTNRNGSERGGEERQSAPPGEHQTNTEMQSGTKKGKNHADETSEPTNTASGAQNDTKNNDTRHTSTTAATAPEQTSDEQMQAREQWLRRIPDDPAGLLKRKFQYQYRQRQRQQPAGPRSW